MVNALEFEYKEELMMSYNVWDFIGVQRSEKSNADFLLKEIFSKAFLSLFEQFKLNISEILTIEQLIKSQLTQEQGYFFEWLDEEGLDSIRKLELINIEDTEDNLHFLEYRQMLIEMDIENGIVDSLLTSIAETITSIDQFIENYLEQAATISFTSDDLPNQFMVGQFSITKGTNSFIWNNETNPAETQQDFC